MELQLEHSTFQFENFVGLSATIHFIVDDRLENVDSKKVIIDKNASDWNIHTFKFESTKDTFDKDIENLDVFPKPIEVQIFVDWDIVNSRDCESEPNSHCLIIDPDDQNTHKQKREMYNWDK